MLNLLSGCLAILLSFHDLALAGLMVLMAGFFDFIDGFAARLLGSYPRFGKELDSLADMVSFGVAPSFIIYQLFLMIFIMNGSPLIQDHLTISQLTILSSSFLPAVFTAIRLARFNIETENRDEFRGLPSPASGICLASLGYITVTGNPEWIAGVIMSEAIIMTVTISLSVLMVLPVKMLTIKFRNYRIKGNESRYLFAVPSVLAFIILGIGAIPPIIIFYILMSLAWSSLPVR